MEVKRQCASTDQRITVREASLDWQLGASYALINASISHQGTRKTPSKWEATPSLKDCPKLQASEKLPSLKDSSRLQVNE